KLAVDCSPHLEKMPPVPGHSSVPETSSLNGERRRSRPTSATSLRSVDASAMLEAKNSRKRAEADVQLLANRLAHLKVEEEKARKKVEETQARAREIIAQKRRNQDLQKMREASHREKSKVLGDGQKKTTQKKLQMQETLAHKKKELVHNRHSTAKSTREEKQSLQMELQDQRARQIEENRRRTDNVRKHREELRRKREEEERRRKKQQQLEYSRKIAEESNKTLEAERLISQLERDEDALIARLKKAHEEQRKAYSALQSSLEL
ncbi:unnamed protein product, partial [Chrysoparadoxa australica]